MNTIEKLGEEETFRNIVERSITEFEDSKIEVIGDVAFCYCNALTSVSFPAATRIGESAFSYCNALTSVSFPAATRIGTSAFYNCIALTSVSFPVATSIEASAFQSCSTLTSASFPVATSVESQAFYGCSKLTSVSIPAATIIGEYAFYDCSKLTSVKLPAATSIGNSAFYDCSKLTTMYIGTESDTVCTLSSKNSIPSNVTKIYVPADLLDPYKTATNWSRFADKIQTYETPVSCQSLTITAEDVPWYEASVKIHYEAVCTYSIEGMMQTGTKVFKGTAVSDTFGTNPSEESSRQVEVSYIFLDKTATTTITQGKHLGNPVGGKIYYIDDTADGTYLFYDVGGNPIPEVSVGSTPRSYTVLTAGSKDKYYVYHDKLYTSLTWGKSGITTGATGTAIGTGKSNTAILLATNVVSSTSTIWYQLQQIRNASTGGCNDWFVPSKDEIEKLRLAVNSGSITEGTIAGSSYEESVFKRKYLWSSSEYTNENTWCWSTHYQDWRAFGKYNDYSVFFARAF